MAISVVGSPTTNQGNSSDFTVDVPSETILAGDYIVVAAFHCESEDNTWGVPSGMDGEWVSELQCGQTPPSNPGVQVFFELCSGGESGSRGSDGTFNGGWGAICFILRGVDATTPLDVTPTTVQSSSTGQPNPPAITPSSDNCMILAVGVKDDASNNAQTVSSYSSGYSTIQSFVHHQENVGGLLAVCATILSGGSGVAENPGTITGSLGNDEWAAASIALRPGPTADWTQEGYQWRDDDGDEANASNLGAQDSPLTAPTETTRRLRVLLDTSDGDPNPAVVELQWSPDETDWYTVS